MVHIKDLEMSISFYIDATSQPTVAFVREILPGHSSELKLEASGFSPLPAVWKDIKLAPQKTPAPTPSALSKNDAVSEPDKSPKSFKFSFPDGNVILLIEGTLYHLHHYLFIRHSSKSAAEFLQYTSDNDTLIKLDATDKQGFEALLSILYPLDFTRPNIEGVASWVSVLHIATEWGFKTIRELAIQSLAPIISPVDQVAREESLTFEEGRRLGLENVIAIDCARQEIRDQMAARSTAALTTTHCLACKASDIYTPPSPKVDPSAAQDPPSLVSFWTTRTSSMPTFTALPTPDSLKSSAGRVCGVQRGKLSPTEISRQVARSIPQLVIA
ncbi:hypothetical protein HETIRDRAFT_102171 [Heterobasidion irregulare TC 32-1]|uniref:BTB domain-containing protein n=1 Tax=Heterobasidion irregulare (strain TC 32-1) TaxID=747525 RepID=W4K715_HETIT|nr:uncharacterized protein HETIRDRAFT_102171 [Heterobasidion irregulare TC 32-1]ETW81135.1 hypothetical protein HETIRDRAFT_102171 [Heterobasidion irregulare TC 32-1]